MLDKRTLDAGARACAQLVRAVSSATSAPLRRAAAGSALARLHQLLMKSGSFIIAGLLSVKDVRTTVSALAEVYSVSLREVATPTPAPGPSGAGEEQAGLKESKDISGAGTPKLHAAEYGQQPPGSGRGSRGAESGSSSAGDGAAAGDGAGPFPEDWVPLLVDSSALVANCLGRGGFTITPTAAASGSHTYSQVTEVYACNSSPLASALLLSDALPALSRLLSAEAQRGPARALLTPRQLATCLQPLNELIAAAANLHDKLLPVSPQGLPQPHHPATSRLTTATTIPAPKPLQGTETCPEPPAAAGEYEGSAAAPVTQGHTPTASVSTQTPHQRQTLGPAVLCAVAESGVMEAACRAAVGALEQHGGGGRQQQPQQKRAACVAGSGREELLLSLLDLPRQLLTLLWDEDAGSLPEEPMRTILTGPCVQVRVGARQRKGRSNGPRLDYVSKQVEMSCLAAPASCCVPVRDMPVLQLTANVQTKGPPLPLQYYESIPPTGYTRPSCSTPWPPIPCPSCTPWMAVRRTACRTTV